MVQSKRKLICYDCHHKLLAHELSRCDHCRALHNIRARKYKIRHRGIWCRDCSTPISKESNGGYLTCTNCRHLKNLRRI